MDGPITSRRGSLCTTWRRAVPLPLTGRTDGLTQGYHTWRTQTAIASHIYYSEASKYLQEVMKSKLCKKTTVPIDVPFGTKT